MNRISLAVATALIGLSTVAAGRCRTEASRTVPEPDCRFRQGSRRNRRVRRQRRSAFSSSMPRTARWTCSTARIPQSPLKVGQIDAKAIPGYSAAALGSANSVAARDGLVAVAIEASPLTNPGVIAFYDAATLGFLRSVPAGALPDAVTFSNTGHFVIVSNEGEPRAPVDPEGSVTIVDVRSEGQGAPLRCLHRRLPGLQFATSRAGRRRRLHRPGRGIGRAGPRARVRVGAGQQRLRDAAGEQRDRGRAAQPVPCRPHHADRRQEPRPAAELARHLRPRDRQRQGQDRHSQLAEPPCPLPAGLDRKLRSRRRRDVPGDRQRGRRSRHRQFRPALDDAVRVASLTLDPAAFPRSRRRSRPTRTRPRRRTSAGST